MAENAPLGFEALPNELLDVIARILDQSTLYSLALVCKKINASATAALYKSYINAKSPCEAPFRLLLRTACKSPRLAALVKSINVRGWRSEFEVATGALWKGYTAFPGLSKPAVRQSKPLFCLLTGSRLPQLRTTSCSLRLPYTSA